MDYIINALIRLFNMFWYEGKETKKMVHGKMVNYMHVRRKRNQKWQFFTHPPQKTINGIVFDQTAVC